MSQRKINFFFLQLSENERTFEVENSIDRLLNYINSLSRTRRKQDISNERICFLERYLYDDNTHIVKLLFKSAKHSYRAPLLNRNTVESRENPKTMEEGEQIKTHLLIKFKNGDAIVFLETGRDILTMKNITDYLNLFISIFNNNHRRDKIEGTFRFDMIPRDDFREVLDNMHRVTCVSIYVQKQILGSDALNFSNTTHEAKEDIVIEVKAQRGLSLKTMMYDLLAKFNGGQTIQRIRATGKLSDKSETIIDTSFIIKKEYIDAQRNEDTGEYNTDFMFSQLMLLSNSF